MLCAASERFEDLICPNCGTNNGPGAKFCQECATALASACPNCGTVANPGAKFCQECAAPLNGVSAPPTAVAGSSPAQASAAAAQSERKLVTVLFADLVGFTPFAEERDAEDVRDTLSRYFDLARELIERYGGTVEKFIGDAVMAVWGAPLVREDDAELAVRAGLELVEAVTSLGAGIQARCGILTGEAAVTIGATNQGMVAGDLVNTASRLQSVAQPGSVLVGESTHRAASAAIVFEAAGEQILKGKESPVPAWRAVRVVGERGGRNRSEQLEAPFVGRQEELRLLRDLFHATAREKRLRVVSVIGPGGIGKSRLSWEFSNYLDGVVETIYWHRGRSPAYGQGISFWALGEMVRERAGLAEQDDEPTTRAKVREQVALWVTDPDEREWVERALLTLLGVESGMAADQLFGAWRMFFERIAERGPVVLLFEDMHFADAGLLDFVDHLLDWSRGLPIYVVTLARPDLIERRPSWGAGKRNFVSLYLEPLSDEDMRELLAGLVPGLPEKAVSTIVARADGIPLYAVETVRTLSPTAGSCEEGGVYVPHGAISRPWPCRKRSPRSSPHGSTRSKRLTDASFTMPPFWARASRPTRSPQCSTCLWRSSSHASRRSCAASCCGARWTRARPSVGNTHSSRRSSARSPTTRCPRRTARSSTSPRLDTSRAWAVTRSQAYSPRTTSPPTRTRLSPTKPPRLRPRHASRSERQLLGPSHWAASARPSSPWIRR